MILLDGHSLTKKTWFRPDSQPMNLEERKSTTSLVLGPEAPEIEIGAWLLDDCEPGAGIIWQVKTVDRQVETGMRTIQAEHVITTLRDEAVFGEITAGDIGSGGDVCSAQAAIAYLLSRTELWTLGDFEPTDVLNPYRFTSTNLFSAIETVTGTLEDAYWDYDLTSIPFKLHIRKLGGDCDCEMRMSRNIQTMRISIDRSRMYTRIYPIGYDDLHIPGDYLSRNEAAYGVISRIEQDQSKETVAELTMWAEERLRRHSEPTVTVTIDGYELARETGEELDRFGVCAQCRVPVAELGQTYLERVTRLKYRDKIADPERVTVTLANEVEDVASIMRRQQTATDNAARSSGKKSKKKYEEDHAWFVDTTDHVAMVAEAIIGQGPDGVDWSRVATLSVDGYGIHARVIRAEGYLVTLQSEIQQTEERLSGEFVDRIASLRSEFEISAESLRIAFEAENASVRSSLQMTAESMRTEFVDDIASVRSLVTQTASSWQAKIAGVVGEDGKVTAASIAIAINEDDESEISLKAERIDIDGLVEKLDAYDLSVATLEVQGQSTFMDTVYIEEGGLQADDIKVGPDSNENYHTINVADVQIDTNDPNKLIISYVDGTSATFNRAASAHISAGSWSGGVLQINASPGAENYKIGFGGSVQADMKLVLAGDGLNPVAHESNEKFLYLPVKVQKKDDSTTPPTFADVYGPENLIVDCTSVWNAGRASVEPVTPQLSGSWNTGTHILTVTSNPQAAANYTVGFGGSVSANEKLVLAGDGLNPVAHGTNAKYLYLPVKVQKKDDSTNPPTFTDVYGPENLIIDCSDVWDAGEAAGVITGTTAGKAAVGLDAPTWNTVAGQQLPDHRTLTIQTSGKGSGQEATQTKTVYIVPETWSNGSIPVKIRDTTAGGAEVARVAVELPAVSATTWTNVSGDTWRADLTIGGAVRSSETKDFTAIRTAGKQDVTLNAHTWNALTGDVVSHREISVKTSGRTPQLEEKTDLYLVVGSWSQGAINVALRDGSATGNEVARLPVALPPVAATDWMNDSGNEWYTEIIIGNAIRASAPKDFTFLIEDGYDLAAGQVRAPVQEGDEAGFEIVFPSLVPDGDDVRREPTTLSYTMTDNGNNDVVIETTVDGETVVVAEYTHGKYDAGWGAAYGKISLPDEYPRNEGSLTATATFLSPRSTPNNTANTDTYTIKNDGNNAVILVHNQGSSDANVVARFVHDKYTAGAGSVSVSHNPTITYVTMTGYTKASPEFRVECGGQSKGGWVTIGLGVYDVPNVGAHNCVNVYQESDGSKIIGRIDIQDFALECWQGGYNYAAATGAGGSSGGSLSSPSDILISDSQWVDSTQERNFESANGSATNLSNTGTVFKQHKNGRGYVYFKATLSGVSGQKWYKIPVG